MLKFLRLLLCSLFLLSGLSLAAEELPAYYKATSTVRLRPTPSTEKASVGRLEKGERVVITQIVTGVDGRKWGYCCRPTSIDAWACLNYMRYDGAAGEYDGKYASFWSQFWNHLLNFLGRGQENVWWFYGCLTLICFFIFLNLAYGEMLLVYFITQVLIMGTIYAYVCLIRGEHMWMITWDKVGMLILPGVIFIFSSIYLMGSMCKQHLKAIRELFSDPITSILMVALGIGWGFVTLLFFMCFFLEHEYWGMFFLLGLLPPSHVPTIYVDGEGHITGHGYGGGSYFHGDNGHDYHYDGSDWHRS